MSDTRYEDVLELLDLDRGLGPDRFTPEHGTRDAFLERTLDLAAMAQPLAPRVGSVVAPDSRPLSEGARVGMLIALAAGVLLTVGAVAFFWMRYGDREPVEQQPVADPQPPEEQAVQPEELPPEPLVEEGDALATAAPETDSDAIARELAAQLGIEPGKASDGEAVAPPKASKGTGRLNVNSKPWSQVFVDGKKVGNTPIAGLELKPGSHTVKLKPPLSGVVYSYKVAIKAGATTTLVKDLENENPQIFGDPHKPSGPPGKLSVQTKPWCTVYINGRKIKNTPLVNYSLKPGTYDVTVENPTYSIKKTYRVKIKPGATTTLVKTLI